MEHQFNVCRLCMMPNLFQNQSSLYKNDGKSAKQLFVLAGISFEDEEFNYPAIICETCEIDLEKAFRFRQKCLESKKHLTSKLSQYLTSLQQEISLKTNYIRENYSNSKDFTDDEEMEDEEIEDENNNITTFIDLTEDSNASSDVCLVENDSGFLEPSPVITANAHTSQQQQIAENIPVSFQLQTNINNSILLNDEKNCKYCNKKYQRKGFMANHVKKKHKIIPIPEVIHTPKPSIKHTPKRSINHTPEPSVEQKTLRENYLKDPTRFIFPLNRRSSFCHPCTKHLSAKDVQRHITRFHSERNNECDFCGKKYPKKILLLHHIKIVHLKPSKLENIIDFPAGRIISRRMTTYERIESPSPKTYNCSLCKAIFWTEDLLNVHKKDCHIVYCNTCGRLFESIQGLSRHMVFAHKTIQPREPEVIAPIIENVRRKSIAVAREHVCQICNRTFNTEKRFIKHMEKHPKEFQCEHCSVKTYYLYALKSHIRNEHNDKHNK